VTASTDSLSINGLIAAVQDTNNKSTDTRLSVTVQEVSINGTPVVNTSAHEYVGAIHKRILAGHRHKGSKSQPPSYVLHMKMSHDDVTFTGPALCRSALISMSDGVQQMLASVLFQAWGKAMPVAVLTDIQGTIEKSPPLSAVLAHVDAEHAVQCPADVASMLSVSCHTSCQYEFAGSYALIHH
jgi:hypothetical protein